jgi:pimeloyl-ACP methyl ester carboxylesterase
MRYLSHPASRKSVSKNVPLLAALLALAICRPSVAAAELPIRNILVSPGVELHYVESGSGTPVIFVHGSLGDGGYWNPQVIAFAAAGYRAISYSRRYNPPNTNQPRPGDPPYSAITDADDLAAFIRALRLGKAHIVGHSYGALTALFLASKHPELVRTLTLAEAPAVSLLRHLPAPRAGLGQETFDDIQTRMVAPMKTAFAQGDREAGVRAFINYVLDDPRAWDKFTPEARQDSIDHAREWDIVMTTGTLFPELDPAAVRRIHSPALLLSGANSYRFLGLIDEEVHRLLPHASRIILPGATHRMWYEQPETCRKDVLDFLKQHSGS